MWNITLLWLLCCPVLSWLYFFFSQLRPGRTPGRNLTVYGLNDASSPKDVPFGGFEWPPTILTGSKRPKTPKKGAWLGIFQPKSQNYKIVISPAGNIGSIPNFDMIIEPHSWLRGWSWITKFLFKMADGRHIAEYWKRCNSPINGPIWMKLGWSHHIVSPICPPCCGYHGNGRCLATAHNGAFNIQQLWASGGRTREPILIKFGTQQHVRTRTTVTWLNF